jgi:hypothetical protein
MTVVLEILSFLLLMGVLYFLFQLVIDWIRND